MVAQEIGPPQRKNFKVRGLPRLRAYGASLMSYARRPGRRWRGPHPGLKAGLPSSACAMITGSLSSISARRRDISFRSSLAKPWVA